MRSVDSELDDAAKNVEIVPRDEIEEETDDSSEEQP
jgi:hypothetical protein